MHHVHYITYTQTDDDTYGLTAFFLAASAQEAQDLLEKYNRRPVNIEQKGFYTDAQIDMEIANDCILFAFEIDGDVGDKLLAYILRLKTPEVDEGIMNSVLSCRLPQSFAFLLDHVTPEQWLSRKDSWLSEAVDWGNWGYIDTLIARGSVDNGRNLAIACQTDDRILFDVLYPISNPRAALEQHPRNFEWIEDILNAEQNMRISEHMPTRSKQGYKKI